MNNSRNKAIQYIKILEEYDQADSIYDTTVYAGPVQTISDLQATEQSFSVEPTYFNNENEYSNEITAYNNQKNQKGPSKPGKTPQALWYSAIVNEAWDVVEKSIETSDQVINSAWQTVEALGSSVDNMKCRSQHQSSSTNVVLPQSGNNDAATIASKSSKASKASNNGVIPEPPQSQPQPQSGNNDAATETSKASKASKISKASRSSKASKTKSQFIEEQPTVAATTTSTSTPAPTPTPAPKPTPKPKSKPKPSSTVTKTKTKSSHSRTEAAPSKKEADTQEARQPTQGHHDSKSGKRLDPEETSSVQKEKKELMAQKRAARAKKKGALMKTDASHSTGPKERTRSIPKVKETVDDEDYIPGVPLDPPGAPAEGYNDDATVSPVRMKEPYKVSKQMLQAHVQSQYPYQYQRPRSIVRYDLEPPTTAVSKPWDMALLQTVPQVAIAECTGVPQRAASPVPLRPCDIPRGAEIKKRNESIFANLPCGAFLSQFGL